MQVSTGHLQHPEALEPTNVQRTTASVTYYRDALAASLIWGHNHKPDGDTDSVTAEGTWTLAKVNYVTGRSKWWTRTNCTPATARTGFAH